MALGCQAQAAHGPRKPEKRPLHPREPARSDRRRVGAWRKRSRLFAHEVASASASMVEAMASILQNTNDSLWALYSILKNTNLKCT